MSWSLIPAARYGEHAEDWAALNVAGPAAALLAPEFVQPLLTEFGNGSEQLALWRQPDGRIGVMTLLTARKPGVWETFQPSQAPVTLWLERDGAVAPDGLPELLQALMRALPGKPLLLGVTQRDPAVHPQPLAHERLEITPYIDTARISLTGSFAEFWEKRGKNLRTNMKKQRNKLQKEEITPRMEVSRLPQQMAAAVDDFGRLESAGWKAGEGTAIHAGNAQGRFYRSMLENMARQGKARVYRYWFDQRLVAMNICVEGDDSLVILKTTYDESLGGQYTPAFLLLEEICQQLYAERRLRGLEFYGKVMEWHTRWSDDIRTLYHINSYRWSGLRRLHQLWQQRRRVAAAPQPE
jgi:hypothetical protein